MKILIIGSKGFIGKHCITYFKEIPNIQVFGCDVVVDYTNDNYYLIDTSTNNYNQIFKSNQFDVCINCSGAASVPHSIKNPMRDFQLNTANVFKLLDSIRQYNSSCKFINLSSAAVYGNPQTLPIVENQKIAPVSPYGYHKWKSEIICKEMNQLFGLQTKSLRIFSAYGEGLQKQLFWDLYKKSRSGSSLELFGTGKESRDFIHVQDIIQIIHLVIQKDNFDGEALNVANGEEIFIQDAVHTFFALLGNPIEYQFKGDIRKGDPINWVADIQKIKQFGYQQNYSLTAGLTEYVTWLKELK